MAKQENSPVSSLALFKKHASLSETLEALRQNKDFKRSVEKSMSTGRMKLQEKREGMAEKAKWLRTISDELFVIENQITVLTERLGNERGDDQGAQKEETRRLIAVKGLEAQRLMNLAQLTLMSGYLDGLGLQVDCLTIEEPCKIKTKEEGVVPGKRRISLAEMLNDLGEDVEAIAIMFADYLHPMLRDIGVKMQAFVNENGMPLPAKYDLKGDDEGEEAGESEPPTVEEGEAVSVQKLDAAKAKTVDEMRQELSKQEDKS